MNIDLTVEGAIYDIFAYDNEEIVVFNNRNSDNEEFRNLLLLGRIVHSPFGNKVHPVDAEEYDKIADYYLTLKSVFLKQEEDNNA